MNSKLIASPRVSQQVPVKKNFTKRVLSAIAGAVLAAVVPGAHGVEMPWISAEELTTRISLANSALSYRGIVSYEHGGALKTLRVAHSVKNDQAYERIEYLDGPKQEYIRRGGVADCERGENATGVVGMGETRAKGKTANTVDNHYRLINRGLGRIADREVYIVHLLPQDKYRFGHVLAVDRESHLLMQALLVDGSRRVLERFQFVQIEVGAVIDDSELEPVASSYLAMGLNSENCLDKSPGQMSQSTSVFADRPHWVPPGFVLTGTHAPGGTLSGYIYSDGLAVFSLFIDSGRQFDVPPLQARRGASVVYMATSPAESHYTASVVGEIPMHTAQRIVHSVMAANTGVALEKEGEE